MYLARTRTPSRLIIRALELAGSAAALAAYLRTTNHEVIRWMLGHASPPQTIEDALHGLLESSPEEIAQAFDITCAELHLRRSRRQHLLGAKDS
jgi:hypothetical protein